MDLGAPSWWLIQSLTDAPLIFEVKAIEQIHALLKPALRHILNTLLQAPQARISRFASKILENLDEIWVVISGLLEAYYLKTWKASFAEHFYGLKRKIPDVTDWRPWSHLPLKGLSKAWALLVIVPYLKEKLDQYHEIWTRQERSAMLFGNQGFQTWPGKVIKLIKRMFIKIYPYILRGLRFLSFIQILRYIHGYSQHPSLNCLISGHSLIRLSGQDFRSFEQRANMKRREWELAIKNGSFVGCLRVLLEKSSSFVFETFKTGLPLIIMGYQVFEGWSASEAAQKSSQVPTPPPPVPFKRALNGIPIPQDSNLCPLCLSSIEIPTLIPSGYVFCYSCIIDHLRTNSFECPITRLGVEEDQLVRLYTE